ncbi:MAG: hypothetical protein LBF63_01365 [Treponema sp.]|jgi:hypothetical protein|nr:hypothetical protein [Treponema sp.]
MKQGTFFVLIGLVGLATITSCKSFQVSGLEVHQVATQGTIIGDFDITVYVPKFLGSAAGVNLFNVSSTATDPRVIQAIRREVQDRGGTSAINVKMEQTASFIDVLLNAITFYLYAPATVHVTGTIIK